MDQGADDIQQNIRETRHDIEETRASMIEKLELLEERVRETVESAKSTVDDIMENVKETVDDTVGAVKGTVDEAKSTVENIVENVKDTVNDTVTRVKHTFDLQYQMETRPWLMLGVSAAFGYLLGSLGARSAPPRETAGRYASGAEALQRSGYYAAAAGAKPYSGYPTADSPSSRRSGFLGQFQEEFDMIKIAVMGAMMSSLRDMVKQSMPSGAPQLEKAINSAATKLGAGPLEGAERQTGRPAQSSQPGRDAEAHRQEPAPTKPGNGPRDQITL
ncbi:MAG TPA: hypothetical protein VNN62_01695 [Methylomirabilota bacterium]|jgi:ElaB/YqjD/DUF883 family membrane-anchored ribosome-binding protein|nr:hypothetical protein [Methylomirabilota bacterium]